MKLFQQHLVRTSFDFITFRTESKVFIGNRFSHVYSTFFPSSASLGVTGAPGTGSELGVTGTLGSSFDERGDFC